MKNKNYQKGFSALVFVIVISSVITFLAIPNLPEENILETQLSATERHFRKVYEKKSADALLEIERIHSGSESL